MHCVKLLGHRLIARDFDRRAAEFRFRVVILNGVTAVGTPTSRGDEHADLTYVVAAAADIARAMSEPAVVVNKSTVPVGTNRKVAEARCCCRVSSGTTTPRRRGPMPGRS